MRGSHSGVNLARRLATAWLGLGIVAGVPGVAAPLPAPKILSLRPVGTNLLVSVNVPRGWPGVVLESRERTNAGAWVPRAVSRQTGRVVLQAPDFLRRHQLQVRGMLREPLPAAFYRGRRAFASRKSSLWRPEPGQGTMITLAADGSLPGNAMLPAPASDARTVLESDIWKLSGDTLYFFNQLRGLQLIDVSNPDAPVVRGSLELPAVGEQMYLLDAQHVLLLAQDNCGGDGESRVLVVDVSGATPQTVVAMPVAGSIQESRLVGRALYVATQGYQPGSGTNADNVELGTFVYSFDLANAASPVARSRLWYSGYANTVMATDRWLFVAMQNYSEEPGQAVVRVIDASAADGTLRDVAGIRPFGEVADKFKMNLSGDVFTVVSQAMEWYHDDTWDTWIGTWVTRLETFSLTTPSAPAALGSLELARGDGLFATRFDGTRAYVVTFRQVDPLWVVDLSNPAAPVLAGSVEVPGYSTYLHPLGNRLLTVGVATNRVAVSLFDVTDATNPALLSRVPLGENYSWSEANDNEKALTVLGDLGLVLVPYQGNTTNGWTTRVQLLDLAGDSLTARGAIDHAFAPRRATAHRGRVISVSNEQFLSADITDRDHPVVTAEKELAWPVNRIFLQGDYVLELTSSGGWWFGADAPVVRVAPAVNPNETANRLDLSNLPVAGATVRNGRLYLLQQPAGYDFGGPVLLAGAAGASDATDVSTNLLMTVLDVSALPAISVLGQTVIAPDSATTAGGSYQAVWPTADLLVWFSTGFNYWVNPLVYAAAGSVGPTTGVGLVISGVNGAHWVTNACDPGGVTITYPRSPGFTFETLTAATGTSVKAGVQPLLAMPYWRPWWGNGGARLLAFNVNDPASPQWVSSLNFNPTNAWGFSSPRVAQGRVYFTHEQSDYAALGSRFGWVNREWRVSDHLDVIDYADPANPTARPPIPVPGQLADVSDDGAMVYLLGNAMSVAGAPLESRAAVNACAYDGVSTYLVSALALPTTWPQPVAVNNSRVCLGRATATAHGQSALELWALSPQGQFTRRAVATVPQPVSALAVLGDLVVAQDVSNQVTLFDATAPPALPPCGQSGPTGRLWFDLNRAAGALNAGVWIPLDDYGVQRVTATAAK